MSLGSVAFVDVETSGLSPEAAETIEVYVERLNLDSEVVEGTYEAKILPTWSINPDDPVQAEALEINGYNDKEWNEFTCVSEASVVDRLYPLLEKATLIGYNTSFDESFIAKMYRRQGKEPNWYHRKLDLCSLAWPLFIKGEIESTSLKAVCEYLGISNEGSHRAKVDVERVKLVYIELMKRYSH